MRVLVTRPSGDGEATAALLHARGHEALLAPLMAIRFHDGADIALDGVQAILATSANGVRALARRTTRRDVPLFAVGRQTAQEARMHGFATVRSADGDGADLAKAAMGWAKPQDGALLHVAGTNTKGDLAASLRASGFEVRIAVLYDAVAADALPDEAVQAIRNGALDAVLLFSPRGARIFANLAAGLDCSGVTAVCISEAAAKALGGLALRAVLVAERPDQDALLARLKPHL
jgi:uroporphyrinogen-III synthase